jgi:hypothetical protein
MAQAAAPAAVIGLGLSAASSIVKAQGTANADTFQAEEMERQAEYGRLKATQTGAQLTEKLDMQLGNIDAVRAAMHDDPTSPTGAAIRDWQEEVGTRQKTLAVGNIMEQLNEDENAAGYERSAANCALLGGVAGGLGSALTAASRTNWSNFGSG